MSGQTLFGLHEHARVGQFVRVPVLIKGCVETCRHLPITHLAFRTYEEADAHRPTLGDQPIPFQIPRGYEIPHQHHIEEYRVQPGEGCAHALMTKLYGDTWEWEGPRDPWDLRDRLDALDCRRVHQHVRDLRVRMQNLCVYAAQIGLDIHWR